ncbi:MAG: ATP-binding cassette domain-containing protein [Campylobacterota bacterium]|nr:ATP-binding cassette domain-containing protein [Campylobacterota bacterium]
MITVDLHKRLLGSSGEMDLDVSFSIKEHEFAALTGESGSGKTTLLRILAGLEKAEGIVEVNGVFWQDKKIVLAPQKRGIGFVFQDYALFPNMSVEQNLLYVQRDKLLSKHLLEMTGLYKLRDRLPATLSGGQKQRVSLCRALMSRPKLLLMDEPLSALDPAMRTKLQHDILQLHKEFGTTTIMVSHDPSEIYRLADRVILLNQGKITQEGTPKDLLLQTQGSQKFSLRGELLDIIKADVIHVAIIAIGQQIVEVVLDEKESQIFQAGDTVQVSTKAFAPSISKIDK